MKSMSFHEGGHIHGVLVANECVEEYRSKNKEGSVMKLDLEMSDLLGAPRLRCDEGRICI